MNPAQPPSRSGAEPGASHGAKPEASHGTKPGASHAGGLPRLIVGAGCLGELGTRVAALATGTAGGGGGRWLLVSDPGLVACGHVARAVAELTAAGLRVAVFTAVRENPDTEDVAACLAAARRGPDGDGIDGFVALGGGSALDTAKGANFLLTNGGVMADYWVKHITPDRVRAPLLPLVAIPTTAGTGSEVQCHALIADAQTHVKMACGHPAATPALVLLDPELTLSLPPTVTAATGIDAVSHAVESLVTRTGDGVSQSLAVAAFRLLNVALPRVLAEPADLAARGGMLWGACLAGLAIERSMLGAAHAAANPLTAHFGVPHGWAVGCMLPGVVCYNGRDARCEHLYAQLLEEAPVPPVPQGEVTWAALAESLPVLRPAAPTGGDGGAAGTDALAARLRQLNDLCEIPSIVGVYGASIREIARLSQEADSQWTARHNPVAITAKDFEALYHVAFTS